MAAGVTGVRSDPGVAVYAAETVSLQPGVTIHGKVAEFISPRSVSLGAVYATLDRLEDKGFVTSWMSDPTPERGGRSKRHYQLEAPGERALHDSAVAAKRVVDHLERLWGGDAWNPSRRWKPARQR